MNTQIETLRSHLTSGQILPKDKDFAASLVSQFDKKGDLSPKQWPWVEKLAGAPVPAAVPALPAAPGAWVSFYEAVPADHKLPQVILAAGDQRKFGTLRLSKKPHASYIKIQFRASKTGAWAFVASLRQTDEINIAAGLKYVAPDIAADAIIATLENFANDVPGTLMATGKLFGICANCGKTLTHPVSVKMGIGPVCIKQFPSLLPLWKETETALVHSMVA
jgi:hypothetical protein